ncbi:hypothetical protein VTL71DRAFT_9911 [Oculimacula yallundae]|uniref:Heterokaryon incompatibility domain-containing protein n=1 Tax=Oculimacula yallundae TaxID=86028 RepID=A0ABR4BQW7_9HELO
MRGPIPDAVGGMSGEDEGIGVSSELESKETDDESTHTESENYSTIRSLGIDSSKLCNYCSRLFDDWPNTQYYKNFPHHGSEKSLQDSAKAGCSMCYQFSISMVQTKTAHIKNETWSIKDIKHTLSVPKEFMDVVGIARFQTVKLKTDKDFWIDLMTPSFSAEEFEMRDGRGFEFRQRQLPCIVQDKKLLFEHSQLNKSLSTFDGLSRAKSWLNTCRSSHKKCNESNGPAFTPTRLVDLSGPHPRVRSFTREEPTVSYSTLSHCWGTTQRCVLTASELSAFHEEIPVAALPKTFEEALFVAKYAGFDFIWIDSLCIIQDSIEDWRKESSTMCDVYSNSGLNISATGAADGSGGMFYNRNQISLCQIDLQSANEEGVWFSCLAESFERISLHAMPLMSRAWVLQERLLSPRNLHFARDQLFWECNELHACELMPQTYQPGMALRMSSFKSGHGIFEILTAAMNWHRVVRTYNKCKLTMPKDKLVAIGGLARAMRRDCLGDYVAGMWRGMMEYQLCWRVFALERRPVGYRAPSWSWASVDGELRHMACYANHADTLVQEVLDVVVRTVSQDDPFGEVVSGVLSITADLLVACSGFKTEWAAAELKSPLITSPTVGKGYALQINKDLSNIPVHPDTLDDADTCIDPAQQIFLLPMYRGLGGRGAIGLLLVPTESKIAGRYRRIGFWESITLDLAQFDDVVLAAKERFGDALYASIAMNADGKERKVIEIV